MTGLEIMCLDKFKELESPPDSIGKPTNLVQLHMREYKAVKERPPSI